MLRSEQHGIGGKLDMLEIHGGADVRPRYLPVEYKRGKSKTEDWDRIQLCAQALCIEEMCSTEVQEGAIWYWEERRRETVVMDRLLRELTLEVIASAKALRASGVTPAPTVDERRCRNCSLVDICEPDCFRHDNSESYIEGLFRDEETS
jgi:CRISPR-associated exonuclease Cas4